MAPIARLTATVLDSADPAALGRFYQSLVGGRLTIADPSWVTLRFENGAGLSFQLEDRLAPPVWPAGDDDQQMQQHLDLRVVDLAEAQATAEAAGARAAAFQPQDDVRVMLDPDGHPFCLWVES